MHAEGSCECKRVQFEFSGEPLFRAYCHCTICQDFNQADLADIIVVRTSDVTTTNFDAIEFKNYKQPPILARGRCNACDGVALEIMNLPLMPKLTIFPSQTLVHVSAVPEPSFHMYYHRRVKDADDTLPKCTSHLQSQWRFTSTLLKTLMRRPVTAAH